MARKKTRRKVTADEALPGFEPDPVDEAVEEPASAEPAAPEEPVPVEVVAADPVAPDPGPVDIAEPEPVAVPDVPVQSADQKPVSWLAAGDHLTLDQWIEWRIRNMQTVDGLKCLGDALKADEEAGDWDVSEGRKAEVREAYRSRMAVLKQMEFVEHGQTLA